MRQLGFLVLVVVLVLGVLVYASAPLGGEDAYMFYSLFFFSSSTIVHKYETTVFGTG